MWRPLPTLIEAAFQEGEERESENIHLFIMWGREGGDCAAPAEGSRKRVPGCDTATCLTAHPTPYRPLPVQRYLIQLQDPLSADRIRGNLIHIAPAEVERSNWAFTQIENTWRKLSNKSSFGDKCVFFYCEHWHCILVVAKPKVCRRRQKCSTIILKQALWLLTKLLPLTPSQLNSG